MKRNHIIVLVSIIGLAALTMILNLLSPTEIGPVGVLLFFTTLYMTVFCILVLAMQAFLFFFMRKTKLRGKDYLCAAVLSFGPIMVLMARSFGAINPLTIGLIFAFLFLAEFLVYKKV